MLNNLKHVLKQIENVTVTLSVLVVQEDRNITTTLSNIFSKTHFVLSLNPLHFSL